MVRQSADDADGAGTANTDFTWETRTQDGKIPTSKCPASNHPLFALTDDTMRLLERYAS